MKQLSNVYTDQTLNKHTHMYQTTHFADDAIKCQSITKATTTAMPPTQQAEVYTACSGTHTYRHTQRRISEKARTYEFRKPDIYLLYLSWLMAFRASGVVGNCAAECGCQVHIHTRTHTHTHVHPPAIRYIERNRRVNDAAENAHPNVAQTASATCCCCWPTQASSHAGDCERRRRRRRRRRRLRCGQLSPCHRTR